MMRFSYYKKAMLLEDVKKRKRVPELYIDYLNMNEKHRFTYFQKHIDLFNEIYRSKGTLKINNKYYINEIVINGQKRKPYLDLEKIYPNKNGCSKMLHK